MMKQNLDWNLKQAINSFKGVNETKQLMNNYRDCSRVQTTLERRRIRGINDLSYTDVVLGVEFGIAITEQFNDGRVSSTSR